jgi:hypothetical protein
MQGEPEIREIEHAVQEDLNELGHAIRRRTGELRDAARGFVDEHPLASVGLAFGVGYVLSGALVSKTTARLLTFGGRLLIAGVLEQMAAAGGLGVLASVLQNQASNPSAGTQAATDEERGG